MKIHLLFALLFGMLYASAQNNFYLVTLTHIDEETGLPIKNSMLKVKEIDKSFHSNNNGTIKLALSPGTYGFISSSDNFKSSINTFAIHSDTIISIKLKSYYRNILIDDVDVMDSYRSKLNSAETGIEFINSKTIQTMPSLAGEKDIVKSLALLPGIQIASEGSSDLIVRGGNPDQNLFLLNGIPMYQTNHLFSILSAVNPYFIDDIKVYKSGFGANYGGRVSSIVDMKTKLPSTDSTQFFGEIGLISTKLTFSTPVVKNKLAFMVGVRRTNLDLFAKPFKEWLGNTTFNFYDLSFLANWKINNAQNIKLFQNYSRDNFKNATGTNTSTEKTSDQYNWLNQITGIEWLIKKQKIENCFKLGYSGYGMNKDYVLKTDSTITESQTLTSTLKNIVVANDATFTLTARSSINTGLQIEQYRLNPANIQWNFDQHKINQVRINESTLMSGFIYGAYIFKYKQINGNVGLRGGMYMANDKNYLSLEPRLNFKYDLPNYASIKASYSRTSQPLHLLSNNGLGLPMDLWIGISDWIQPIIADQLAIGFLKNFNFKNSVYEFSSEAYFKQIKNIICYRDGYSSSYLTNIDNTISHSTLNEILTFGNGTAYGLELMLEKKEGVFTGWISYTLSKAKNSFAEFEGGTPFNSPYDRPHNLSIVGNYQLKNNWTFNFTFSLLSGQPFTAPIAIYPWNSFDEYTSKPNDYYEPATVNPWGNPISAFFNYPKYIYSERNGFRLKTFHKLDIGFRKKLKSRNNYNHWIELGAYNVYNRKNTAYGHLQFSGYMQKVEVVSVSLFPIIPSINYGFRF